MKILFTEAQLADHALDLVHAKNVSLLLTDEELIDYLDNHLPTTTMPFPPPKVISPHWTAQDVLLRRGAIRNLDLLPFKSPEGYVHYHSLDSAAIAAELEAFAEEHKLALCENEYPYHLPAGIEQYIVWVAPECTRVRIVEFISKVLKQKSDLSRVIMFERPRKNAFKRVKGTVPSVRHVHVWVVPPT